MCLVPVQLYIYDLSGGVARALSPSLLGIQIDCIYHTSVVVRGIEHFFGGGINVAPAGTTPFGHPIQIVDLGTTFLEEDIIESLLVELSSRFTPESYSLFSNNCNNFSNELSQLLTGNSIPDHIVALPETVLSTPFGQMLTPFLSRLEEQMKSMRSQAFTPQHYHETEAAVAAVNGDDAGLGNAHVVLASETDQSNGRAIIPGETIAGVGAGAEATKEDEGPALLAAEKEVEAAVAECALVDMKQRLEELDLKEGRATPVQQLGEEGAARLAIETAVKNELDKIITESHIGAENGSSAAGGGVDHAIDIKEAEALAVEHVARGKFKGVSSSKPRSSPRQSHKH